MRLEIFCRKSNMGQTNSRDSSQVYAVQIGAKGRLLLPAVVRNRMNLKEGDRLVLTVEDDGSLRLVSLRQQAKKLRGYLKTTQPERVISDELIQERREEAESE